MCGDVWVCVCVWVYVCVWVTESACAFSCMRHIIDVLFPMEVAVLFCSISN
jgi:hypothetical protein